MKTWKDRTDGDESPYVPLGPFKLRLPFLHYRFEWPDYFQGLLMCAVDLAAIPLMTELLGMPFEAALAVVILNGLLYLLHHLLGDPVVPGWITPAIPLLMAYCATFPEGPERVHALVSFQIMLGVLSVFLGMTGLAGKVVRFVPAAIKAGIIMGAGFAAVITVFKEGGRFDSFPWTISIAVGLAFYLIFSRHFAALKQRNALWATFGKLGIFPIIALAIVLAPLFGEARWPDLEWGLSAPDFGLLWREYTVFGLGWPPASLFLIALPTVFATYLVLFGDVIQSKALLDEADQARPDEKIDYQPDRAHLIFGARNALMAVFGPDVAMCGPLWAAMHVVILERYREGRRVMDSVFGGSGSFRWGTNTGLLLMPIVTLVQPILGVALALTLLIQGYVSVRIGILAARSQRDLGIAGVVGAVLATRGAAWAFATGILLCLLIYGRDFFRGETDGTFASANAAAKRHDEE
ncbi:hypothetical protein [Pseudomonas mangrovi]|uniref:Xanthine/uracil/vitamin C permease n=1 Tax=Pseudomonas mangrovi TaxID=2161748 RepID=A0A2T5PFF5_9PSED|nr:hypothetical protein [Pseudomonas mangrovi]PTU76441.1 hypothetical protein DBO85_02030 [Pseudomonas mangrovi]